MGLEFFGIDLHGDLVIRTIPFEILRGQNGKKCGGSSLENMHKGQQKIYICVGVVDKFSRSVPQGIALRNQFLTTSVLKFLGNF